MHHAGATYTSRTLPAFDPPARMSENEGRMMLVGIAPGPEGLELRTFECRNCSHSFTNAVVKDPMNTVAAGWVAGELKPPT